MPRPSPLDIATAVTSRWPTLHVHTANEAAMLAERARLEAELGPLPQADEIEPWDPTEPNWELRVALPEATAETVLRAVGVCTSDRVVVRAGPTPGLVNDLDVGRPICESAGTGPIRAQMWFDPEDGGSAFPTFDGAAPMKPSSLSKSSSLSRCKPGEFARPSAPIAGPTPSRPSFTVHPVVWASDWSSPMTANSTATPWLTHSA